jgi:hypothetical protein
VRLKELPTRVGRAGANAFFHTLWFFGVKRWWLCTPRGTYYCGYWTQRGIIKFATRAGHRIGMIDPAGFIFCDLPQGDTGGSSVNSSPF